MKCPRCDSEIPDEARVCGICYAKIHTILPSSRTMSDIEFSHRLAVHQGSAKKPEMLASVLTIADDERPRLLLRSFYLDERFLPDAKRKEDGPDPRLDLGISEARTKAWRPGLLLFTDRSMLFFEDKSKTTGLIHKKKEFLFLQRFAVELASVQEVGADKGRITMGLRGGRTSNRTQFKELALANWETLTGELMLEPDTAVRLVQETVEAGKHRYSGSIDAGRPAIEFTSIRERLAASGTGIGFLRCSACSSRVTLPLDGGSARCGRCGNVMTAEEAERRIIDLIGDF